MRLRSEWCRRLRESILLFLAMFVFFRCLPRFVDVACYVAAAPVAAALPTFRLMTSSTYFTPLPL